MNMAVVANGNQPGSQSMGSTNTIFITQTWFDPSYLKTKGGIMKVIVIVLNLLGFICIQSSSFWWHGRGVYFNVVAHLGLWFSAVMLLLYLFHVVEKYHNVRWLLVEALACVVLLLLNLVAASMAVAYDSPPFSAAGFFGYLAMVVYGADAYLKARALKMGELAQGRRVGPPGKPAPSPPA